MGMNVEGSSHVVIRSSSPASALEKGRGGGKAGKNHKNTS